MVREIEAPLTLERGTFSLPCVAKGVVKGNDPRFIEIELTGVLYNGSIVVGLTPAEIKRAEEALEDVAEEDGVEWVGPPPDETWG